MSDESKILDSSGKPFQRRMIARKEVLIPLLSGVAGAALTAIATMTTGAFGYLNKDRELDIQMVNVALTILSGDHDTKNSVEARKFALRSLSKYSNVEIPKDEFESWAKTGVLPQGNFAITSSVEPVVRGEVNNSVLMKEEPRLLLARTIWGEARAERYETQKAVAHVVLNRMQSARYGSTVAEVVLARYQFSSWNLNSPDRRLMLAKRKGDDSQFDAIYELAGQALGGATIDPTDGATHYHVNVVNPSWASSDELMKTIESGGFVFYKPTD